MQLFHPCMLVLGLAAATAAAPPRPMAPSPALRLESPARAAMRDAREVRLEMLRGSGGTRRHDVP